MIDLLRVLVELVKLFGEYKDKQERKQKVKELRGALNDARTRKDTKRLEDFFSSSLNADLPPRLYYGNEEILQKQLRERNEPKNLGYGLQNPEHKEKLK